MGQNLHKIEAVRLEGGDPPPQAVSLTAFFPFFFYYFPKKVFKKRIEDFVKNQKNIE